METADDIRRQIRDLLATQSLAVLATHYMQQPYASLVAFVATDDLKHIDFVTPRTTRKYANLVSDKRVAVLVNNSTNQASDFHQALSVTVVGEAEEISGLDRDQIIETYLTKHPYLEEFARSPTCALLRVTAKSYYLVKNFQKVLELHLIK